MVLENLWMWKKKTLEASWLGKNISHQPRDVHPSDTNTVYVRH